MRVFKAGGSVVRVEGDGCRGGEQGAALEQLLFADAIGEEAEVADADQPGRQYVEQKAADELDRIEGHGLGAGMISVVFPLEAHMAVFQSAKTVVGDGDAMSVAGQILQYAPRSAEGRLNVNDPFEPCGCLTQGLERGRLSQIAKLAGEVKTTFAKSPSQREQK